MRINYYTKIQTDALIDNRYCRIVAKLRDQIITNSPDEFLRRYYKFHEIAERIPKIAKYYRNYLLFFCKPIFTNLFINKLIHVYGELKGELYYNANYGNKNKEKDREKEKEEKHDKEKNNINCNKNKNKQAEMLFHTLVKNDIDKNSMTISTIVKDLSYLNINPLNADLLNTNSYNHISNSNFHFQNDLKNKNIFNLKSGLNKIKPGLNKMNHIENNNFQNKINFAGVAVNNFNLNNNIGNLTKRGSTNSKFLDNLLEFNNNNLGVNEKLSMNLKTELGNLYNNLINANMNINSTSNNNMKNNERGFKSNKKTSGTNSKYFSNLYFFMI